MRHLVIPLVAALLFVTAARADDAAPLGRRWYAPVELMPRLAARDGVRWAMPETLAGLAMVGGEAVTANAAIDEAAKQWGLSVMTANGVVVIHRADDARLRELGDRLKAGGAAAAAAAWELGWLRDGRAVPGLAAALLKVRDDPAVGLAAAQAINTLLADVPLGRAERVDARLAGRVSLVVAFPAGVDVAPLLDSPYPAVRAAALRLLLGAGGPGAEAAKAKSAADRSVLVQRVRQQMLFEPPTPTPAAKGADQAARSFGSEGPEDVPPAPEDPAELKAACDRAVDEIPRLAKQSEWAQMRWRARVLAGWARLGHDQASEALIRMGRTDVQPSWFPPYVHRQLAGVGAPAAVARLREVFAGRGAGRDTVVRGLETAWWGEGLLAFTRPHLSEQTLAYVTARRAGREALDDLIALAARAGEPKAGIEGDGGYFALDCLGVVGAPRAVAALRAKLDEDEPHARTLAFRAAKALGDAGGADALAALLAAADAPDRFRRHAAVLFLGRIGGPAAEKKLLAIVDADGDRLIRAAAADALEQIGTKAAGEAVARFRAADEGLPALAYAPRNARFGADFPVNQWVDTKVRVRAYAEWGEMGWNYDAADKLFFRYGGCSGYTSELTLYDAGTERFVQRRPNEEMAGWDDRRPPRGCSAGRTWDPHRKVAWIGPAIGGTDADVAIAEYYNKGGRDSGASAYRLASYDLASDRFRPAELREAHGGEPAQRYVYDWRDGLMFPVKFSPYPEERPFWALDTRAADPWAAVAGGAGPWQDRKTAGPYPRVHSYACAAIDQALGLLVLYVPPSAQTGQRPQTWVYDPRKNQWKDAAPATQPRGVAGGGFVYDPFHKVLIFQSGRKESQFGGPADSMTWSYDVAANTWTDLQTHNGPGNPWVGAMDFDAEHDVCLLFNHRTGTVWAYRYAAVKP